MISISMVTADSNGNVVIKKGKSSFGQIAARVSRVATLDGGVVITHSGVVHGDRTFRISTTINTEQKTAIEYINENSTFVMISCSEGLFLGAISSIDTSTPELTMSFLAKEKIT